MIQKNELVRAKGLDTLRAIAIALVLMTHYTGFVSGSPTFGFVGRVGWAGVDLFFVLSGYLIGNQILSALARKEDFSLKVFFAKRLLRTLPNYYVVLAAYFLLPDLLKGSSTAPLWRFLTFTQNFGLEYGQTFSHSWSLCIEEQFYLVLPLAVLAVASCRNALRVGWTLIVGAILVGMAARGMAWLADGHDAFAAETYYSTLGRFDELLPGVAIAMLKNFHGALYEKILRKGNLLLVVGLAAVIAILYCVNQGFPNTMLSTTLGFSLLAMSYALLLMAALSPNSILSRVGVPGATSLALWSYAVYLMHKPIFMLAAPHLRRMNVDTGAPLTVLLVFAAGIFGGWLLFRFVETPFMQLRARWYPSKQASESECGSVLFTAAARHR
ncbi:acyltransferase [Janthinobacterium sp. BJB412]|nr:acyltransferase [Janthinobacterium sp. BJB412]